MSKESKKSGSQDEIKIETVEEGFDILDETVKKLSDEDISLEESFAVFEKGMKVLKAVNDKIDRVEKQVRIINGENVDDFQ